MILNCRFCDREIVRNTRHNHCCDECNKKRQTYRNEVSYKHRTVGLLNFLEERVAFYQKFYDYDYRIGCIAYNYYVERLERAILN